MSAPALGAIPRDRAGVFARHHVLAVAAAAAARAGIRLADRRSDARGRLLALGHKEDRVDHDAGD